MVAERTLEQNFTGLLVSDIQAWLRQTPFSVFLSEMEKSVVGQPGLTTVLISVYSYLKSAADYEPAGEISKNNCLIAAPSGCGKTETYRALKRYFSEHIPGLPVLIIDMTKATTEGFRGANTSDLLLDLILADTDGIGIVFLEEFDKRLEPQWTVNDENVSNTVQNQLLTVIEGTVIRSKHGVKINTGNTLFVGLGSFARVRELKKEKVSAQNRTIGFSTEHECIDDHYAGITRDDIIDAGGNYEMVGRFPLVVNYDRLSTAAVDAVLEKFAYTLSRSFGCRITLADTYREHLHEISASEYGMRKVYNDMLDTLLPLYTDAVISGEDDITITLGRDMREQESQENVYT